jgi:hypothetical protein
MRLHVAHKHGLLLVALLAATAAPSWCTTARLLQADSYDFFLLVRQWPGTYCGEHACPLLKHDDDGCVLWSRHAQAK